MPTLRAEPLTDFCERIFLAAGAPADEARVVAEALVDANLTGHDSHGVMRTMSYLEWMKRGDIQPGAELDVVAEGDAFAVVDGGWGFGQVQGRKATRIGIEKARTAGVATISGRNCAHLGRLGDYPRLAAEEGFAAVMFINTHGGGILTAPFGGIDRRLSANPIAIAVPRADAPPLVVDVSTCTIAEGKVRNFRTAGQPVPENCIIDSEGNPTTDPNLFYGPPQGALLPIAGHKGYALGMAADLLAGAISGAGCSRAGVTRIGNSFLLQIIDIDRLRGAEAFHADVEALLAFVKSSRLAPGFDEILAPGEPELRTEAARRKGGIPLLDGVWADLRAVAAELRVAVPDIA